MSAALACVAAPVVCAAPAMRSASKQVAAKKVSVANNGVARTSAMQVWTPLNNKFFETFSFLPPLTNEQITKQVDFIVSNGYTPCLEFAPAAQAYVNSDSCNRFANGTSVNYFDNRYWTMWKLPMFGCQDGSQVLKEVSACTSAFPDAYIRLVAFDNIKQVQCAGFLVHRPAGIKEYQDTTTRSV